MIPHDNLEEFRDPANYDLEEGERSAPRIAFYCDLATEVGGPVLEVACGTGLVAIPVAAQGLAVTGVDLARPMLDYAQHKAQRQRLTLRWVEADARHLNLASHFQFIYLTGNAFQAFLRREDQELLLASIKRHLAPRGIFAFETRNPSGHDLRSQDQEEYDQSYTNFEGQRVAVSFRQRYDPLTQIMHWTTYRRWGSGEQAHTKETRIACRFTHPQELAALLHYNGFQILRQYGNWDKEAVRADSPSLITLCAPQAEEHPAARIG
jgi:ubiquinone/menaquinone biosynthesis C-methylase UbiE